MTWLGSGPSASNATSGFVDANTKSTSSNSAAIVSFVCDPLRLDPGAGVEVVDLVGDLQAERDLEGQVVLARGVAVAEEHDDLAEPGERPLEAELGELHRDVDDLEARVAGQRVRRLLDHGAHVVRHHRGPEIERDRGLLAPQGLAVRAEPGFPALDPGEAVRDRGGRSRWSRRGSGRCRAPTG